MKALVDGFETVHIKLQDNKSILQTDAKSIYNFGTIEKLIRILFSYSIIVLSYSLYEVVNEYFYSN